MPGVCAIDFESEYSNEISIGTLGTVNYLRSTDIYLVSFAFEDGRTWVGHPKGAPWDAISGWTIPVHNQAFEARVVERCKEINVIPHWFDMSGMVCTANLSCYLGYPRSLAEAAKHLLGVTLSKDVRAKMKGKQWETMGPEFQEDVKRYALADAIHTRDIWLKHGHRWPQWERELSQLTCDMAQRGVTIDMARVEGSIQKLQRIIWESNAQIPWADSGPALSYKKLCEECRKIGIAPPPSLAMTDESLDAWMEKHPEIPWVTAMRSARRANTFVKKLQVFKTHCRPDGRLSVQLKYCGAGATRRWSGDASTNLQALPREEILGVNLRQCLIAAKGKKFSIHDYAQIEVRVAYYLAGDWAMLEQLAIPGSDIYEIAARRLFGYDRPEKLKDLGKTDPDMFKLRHMSKAATLGCQFGVGGEKFKLVAKLMAGLELTAAEAESAVERYRAKNPLIVKQWRKLHNAIIRSAGDSLEIELPSGNKLVYRDILLDSKTRNYTCLASQNGKMVRKRIWGSLIFENATQSAARDIMGHAMLQVEKAGYPVLFSVHDELCCEIDEREDGGGIEKIMSVAPPWMSRIPLAVESSEATFYSK